MLARVDALERENALEEDETIRVFRKGDKLVHLTVFRMTGRQMCSIA
jgi:hypothetical protein